VIATGFKDRENLSEIEARKLEFDEDEDEDLIIRKVEKSLRNNRERSGDLDVPTFLRRKQAAEVKERDRED
jgi:hypothetical protein